MFIRMWCSLLCTGEGVGMCAVRSLCLLACAIMQDSTDCLVQAQAIACLQHLHMFSPRHIDLASLVPSLCVSITTHTLLIMGFKIRTRFRWRSWFLSILFSKRNFRLTLASPVGPQVRPEYKPTTVTLSRETRFRILWKFPENFLVSSWCMHGCHTKNSLCTTHNVF